MLIVILERKNIYDNFVNSIRLSFRFLNENFVCIVQISKFVGHYFNLHLYHKFQGLWYQIERFPFNGDTQCIQDKFSLRYGEIEVNSTSFQRLVHLSCIPKIWLFYIFFSIIASDSKTYSSWIFKSPLTSDASKLKFTSTFVPHWFKYIPAFQSTSLNYWILSTDYDNYALFYGCNEVPLLKWGTKKIEIAGIYGRSRTLTDEIRNTLREVLDMNGIDSNKLVTVDQTNC